MCVRENDILDDNLESNHFWFALEMKNSRSTIGISTNLLPV